MVFMSSGARMTLCAVLGLLVAMLLFTPSSARIGGNQRTPCTPGGNECPEGVLCNPLTSQCMIDWQEYVIYRACNLTTADGEPITSLGNSPYTARPCRHHQECSENMREITYNGVTMFASGCRRPRRNYQNSVAEEE